MNNTRLRFFLKLSVFTLVFFLLCGLQSSFWTNLISFIPSPQFWLILFVFVATKWAPVSSIFYIYFLGFCLTNFSDAPLKMIWFSSLIMFLAILLIKNRIQLTGVFLFIVLNLIGSVTFELSYYYLSDILEATPTQLMFSDRLVQILINFIFSYPMYFVFEKIDIFIFDENEWTKSRQTQDGPSYE